jgi:O-antigen/teichoic acid export membrane protein
MKLAQKIALNSSAQAARLLFFAVAGIVSVGVATRYLTVDEYGGVLAALVLLSLFSVATDFGISSMTVRAIAREPENKEAIQSSAFWVWTVFGIATALAILAVSQIAYPGPEHATTRDCVLVLMATFPLLPWGGVANTRAIAEQRVWVTSLGSIGARALAVLGVVLAALLDLGPLGVAAAFASGYVLESLFSIALVRPRVHLRRGLDRARIWSLIAAAMPLGMILLINGLYFRLDAFLLSLLGTRADLAVYGVAYKAFDMLLPLAGFVMITLMPELARLEPDEPRFQALVQKAFTGMCFVALPIVGFSLLGGQAMVALAGSKYADGGLVLTLIMLSVSCACLQGVFGHTLVAQGKQRVLLRASAAVLVLNGVLNLGAIPLWGDRGAAAVLVVSELLSVSFTLYVYRRIAPLPRVHAPARLIVALGALIAALSISYVISNAVLATIASVVTGLLAYVGALIALRAVPPYVAAPFVSAVRLVRPRSVT